MPAKRPDVKSHTLGNILWKNIKKNAINIKFHLSQEKENSRVYYHPSPDEAAQTKNTPSAFVQLRCYTPSVKNVLFYTEP